MKHGNGNMLDVSMGKLRPEGRGLMTRVKTIEYMFDDDVLKFWDKEKSDSGNKDFEEIDLNDLIDWTKVNNKAIQQMKEMYPKSTIFVDKDEE
jgi:hypothetical protein